MKVSYPFSGHPPPNGLLRPIRLSIQLLSIHLLLNQLVRIESASLTTLAPISTRKHAKDSQLNRSNDRLLHDDDKQFVNSFPISGTSFEISHEINPLNHPLSHPLNHQLNHPLNPEINPDINLDLNPELNHEIVAQNIDDPNERPNTDLPMVDPQHGQQTFSQIRHRNCGVQQLSAGRLAPLPSLSERHSIAFSKLVKSKLEQHRNEAHQSTGSPFKSENKTNKNRQFYNFEASIAGRRKSNSRRGKVVGGELAYDGEFPWTVSIRKFDAHHCGGVSL